MKKPWQGQIQNDWYPGIERKLAVSFLLILSKSDTVIFMNSYAKKAMT